MNIQRFRDYNLIQQEMDAKLKREAEAYFENKNDLVQQHNNLVQWKQKHKFYLLLLARDIGSEQLSNLIFTLSEEKTLSSDILVETIWAFSLGLSQEGTTFKALADFVAEIDRKNIVERELILTKVPQSLIDAASIMKKAVLSKKAQKAYTKFYYEQNKYSLIRQNNEGYAKLSLFLITLNNMHTIEAIWDKVLCFIGNFDIDPDRVLDLLIESYCIGRYQQIYFELMIKLNKQSLTTILGYRLLKDTTADHAQTITYAGTVENFQNTIMMQLYKQNGFTPKPQIINLIALLVKQQHVLMQDIFAYFLPDDSILEKIQLKKIEAGKEKIHRTFKMMMEEMDDNEKYKKKEEDNLKFLGQLLHSSKLAYIAQCIRINDWANFKMLWSYYKDKVDMLTYQPILHELFNMLDWLIDGVYSRKSLRGYFSIEQDITNKFPFHQNVRTQQQVRHNYLNMQFLNQIKQIMGIIGSYIGFRSCLFIKLCRLFKMIIKEPESFVEEQQASPQLKNTTQAYVKQFLLHYFVPGISFQNQNPTVANQAYQVLQLFDYKFRYECYIHVYMHTMTDNPYLGLVFQNVKNQQNIIVNNLSKENKKIYLKKMAKITHNQALQVFYWIFRRLVMEDYEAVVAQIVSALNNCTQLTLQMSIFVTLHCLTSQNQTALDFKTGDQRPWYKNLIIYISNFYRKYLQTDIQPIFDYIIDKIQEPVRDLQDNEQIPGFPLKLQDALLKKVVGDFVLQQVNKAKYELLASGIRMNFEARFLTKDVRDAKKSKIMLQNFLWKETISKYNNTSLAFNLLILLSQKREQVMHQSFISNIKILGDIYDDFTAAILQLIRVLNYQANDDFEYYKKLLPENAFQFLVNHYKIPLQIAFEIVRPAKKHISNMEGEEWENLIKQVHNTMENYKNSANNNLVTGYEVPLGLSSYLSKYHEKIQKMLSHQFFTTFWMLTLDSISFPQKVYADKIEELKKKIQQNMPSKRASDRNSERQYERMKTLYEKLNKQKEQQEIRKNNTMNQTNMKRFEVEFLKNFDTSKGKKPIQEFAQIFVQSCLLPRILLDSSEALYCMKFTIQVIKRNKLSSSKSIRLLTYIIEYVMNYLPYATEREASNCLAVFLSEILGIFTNWNDCAKLQQDISKYLGIDEHKLKSNYSKLKEYLLKLYQRAGNLIQTIKDEPYVIKNCLYLLQKVESIPSYKQQAQQLENYMKKLKQIYIHKVDMQTILQRQITILSIKKQNLPEIEELKTSKSTLNLSTINNSMIDESQKSKTQKQEPSNSLSLKSVKVSPPIEDAKPKNGNLQSEPQKQNQAQSKIGVENSSLSPMNYVSDANAKDKEKERQKQKQKQRQKSKEKDRQKGRQKDRENNKQKEKQKEKEKESQADNKKNSNEQIRKPIVSMGEQRNISSRFTDEPKQKTVGDVRSEILKKGNQTNLESQKVSNQKMGQNKHQIASHSQKNQEPRSLTDAHQKQRAVQIQRKESYGESKKQIKIVHNQDRQKKEPLLTVGELKKLTNDQKMNEEKEKKPTSQSPLQNLERSEKVEYNKNYKSDKYSSQEKGQTKRYRDNRYDDSHKFKRYQPKYREKRQEYKDKNQDSRRDKERMNKKQDRYDKRSERNNRQRSRSRDNRNRRYYK